MTTQKTTLEPELRQRRIEPFLTHSGALRRVPVAPSSQKSDQAGRGGLQTKHPAR